MISATKAEETEGGTNEGVIKINDCMKAGI